MVFEKRFSPCLGTWQFVTILRSNDVLLHMARRLILAAKGGVFEGWPAFLVPGRRGFLILSTSSE